VNTYKITFELPGPWLPEVSIRMYDYVTGETFEEAKRKALTFGGKRLYPGWGVLKIQALMPEYVLRRLHAKDNN